MMLAFKPRILIGCDRDKQHMIILLMFIANPLETSCELHIRTCRLRAGISSSCQNALILFQYSKDFPELKKPLNNQRLNYV
ncbi:hypothetical protein DOE73_04815 [Paenibacillus dendritiformis]|nr:hypothetical protein DOE73_04815 [Paenibacillus dendritiformis]